MTGARDCICKGQPLNRLVAAFASRARQRVEGGVGEGKPVHFKTLVLTAVLVQKLSAGDSKMPFDVRYRLLDHHLAECPCSHRNAPAGAGSR